MRVIRLFILVFVFLGWAIPVMADSVVYLIRHSERAEDGTNDPHISALGERRSEWFAGVFEGENIVKIYTSPYNRTHETAAPIAERAGISVEEYDPRDLPGLVEKGFGEGVTIVVGHSNTTPVVANLLIGEEIYAMHDESDYQTYYRVILSEGEAPQIKVLKGPLAEDLE